VRDGLKISMIIFVALLTGCASISNVFSPHQKGCTTELVVRKNGHRILDENISSLKDGTVVAEVNNANGKPTKLKFDEDGDVTSATNGKSVENVKVPNMATLQQTYHELCD